MILNKEPAYGNINRFFHKNFRGIIDRPISRKIPNSLIKRGIERKGYIYFVSEAGYFFFCKSDAHNSETLDSYTGKEKEFSSFFKQEILRHQTSLAVEESII